MLDATCMEIPVDTPLMNVWYWPRVKFHSPANVQRTCVPMKEKLLGAHTEMEDDTPSVKTWAFGRVQSMTKTAPSMHPVSTVGVDRTHGSDALTTEPRGTKLLAVTENWSELFCPSTRIQ